MQSDVVRLSRSFAGEFAFYLKDLHTQAKYTYNAATPFYLASVVKVLVMREVYRQVEQGVLRLDQEVEVSAESVRDGAGAVKRAAPGTRFTVDALLGLMMSQSDNAATDLLMELVGLEAINRSVEEVGGFGSITSILDVRRKVYSRLSPRAAELTPAQVFELWQIPSMGARARALAQMVGEPSQQWTAKDLEKAFASYYAGLENSAPLDAMGSVLESLARCEGHNAELCSAMWQKLERCETGKNRLRAHWPTNLVFAHKTGTQHRRICDVGLLTLSPEQQVVMAACAKNFSRRQDAEKLLADLGRLAYQALKRETDPTFVARPVANAVPAVARPVPAD